MSGLGQPPSGPLGASALSQQDGVLRIRNLDTGEFINLDEVEVARPHAAAPTIGSDSGTDDPVHQGLGVHGEGAVADGKASSWFKGAGKKMAKAAKKTMNAIQEKVEENRQERRAAKAAAGTSYTSAPSSSAHVPTTGSAVAGSAADAPRVADGPLGFSAFGGGAPLQGVGGRSGHLQWQPGSHSGHLHVGAEQRVGDVGPMTAALQQRQSHGGAATAAQVSSMPDLSAVTAHQSASTAHQSASATLQPVSAAHSAVTAHQPARIAHDQPPLAPSSTLSASSSLTRPLEQTHSFRSDTAGLPAHTSSPEKPPSRQPSIHHAPEPPAQPPPRHLAPVLLPARQDAATWGAAFRGEPAAPPGTAHADSTHPVQGVGQHQDAGQHQQEFSHHQQGSGTPWDAHAIDTEVPQALDLTDEHTVLRLQSSRSIASTVDPMLDPSTPTSHAAWDPGRHSWADSTLDTVAPTLDATGLVADGQAAARKHGRAGAALAKTLNWGKAQGEKLAARVRQGKDVASTAGSQTSTVPSLAPFEDYPLGMPDTYDPSVLVLPPLTESASQDVGGVMGAGSPGSGRYGLKKRLMKLVNKAAGGRRTESAGGGQEYGQQYAKGMMAGLDEEDEEDGDGGLEDGGLRSPDDPNALLLPKASQPGGLGVAVRTQSTRSQLGPDRLLATVRLVQSLPAHDGVVWTAKFNTAGTQLATGGQDGVVRVWSLATRHAPPHSSLGHALYTTSSASHPDSASTDQPPAGGVGLQGPPGAGLTRSSGMVREGPGVPAGLRGPSWAPALDTYSDGLGAYGESAPGGGGGGGGGVSRSWGAPVFASAPQYVLLGHTEDVIDLAWSAGSFLATASVDGTARLWHIPTPLSRSSAASTLSAPETESSGTDFHQPLAPLQEFTHTDFVTGVCFHPHDPRLLATTCADGRLRVWDCASATVLATATVPTDMLTCVTWMPGSTRLVVGTLQGTCRQYEWQPGGSSTIAKPKAGAGAAAGKPGAGDSNAAAGGGGSTGAEGAGRKLAGRGGAGAKLEYMATIDVKDRRGAAGSGRKVTSVVPLTTRQGAFLVSSNDSRVRLYRKYTLEVKYKGLRNRNTLVKAALSGDECHVVSGSDSGWVYLWETLLGETGASAAGAPHAPTYPSGGTAPMATPPRTTRPGAQPAPGTPLPSTTALRPKNSHYDAFMSEESTAVVALIAPRKAWRVTSTAAQQALLSTAAAAVAPMSAAAMVASSGPALTPLASGASMEGVAASLGASVPALHSPLLGAVFIVAGFSGNLLIYENCA